jgi:signal transduction histidine kinase
MPTKQLRQTLDNWEADGEEFRPGEIMRAVNRVLTETLDCESDANVARVCLKIAEELTESMFGYIGEINERGLLDTIALSDPGWEACRTSRSEAAKLINDMPIRGIWGEVISTGESVFTNHLSSHPASLGTPPGHPKISSYLGVPLKLDRKTIGIISLANKPDGYNIADQKAIEALSASLVAALNRKRDEIALAGYRDELEKRVEERTHALQERVKELNCMQQVTRILASLDLPSERALEQIANVIPPSWQYPDITSALIEIEDRHFESWNHRVGKWSQSADIVVAEGTIGKITVYYHEQRPELDEGPFLKEERALLDAIAREIGQHLDWKRAREMQEQQNRSLTAVLDNFPEIIYVVDPVSHEILLVNKRFARTLGRDVEGGICYKEFQALNKPCSFCTNQAIMAEKGKPLTWEHFNESLGRHYLMTDLIIPWPDGRDVRMEIAVDITKRKKAEQELQDVLKRLERSNRELEQFACVASHDLQEPGRMISSYTQLLAKRYHDRIDKDANDFIGYAVDGANRMQRLINDLLTYSRVTTRGQEPREVESGEVLKRALHNLKVSIEENNAQISYDTLPRIAIDESQLMQLFLNLLGNAMKFRSEEDPRIHVSAERKDGDWIFAVKDNGIGFDPQFVNRIFVIFQRLHGKQDYPGTGIGLAVCKRIVERHGGRMWVDSEPGAGSTFYFTIPIVEEPCDA